MMANLERSLDWSTIPTDVLVHIFSYLKPLDRFHTSCTCKSWNEAFKHPSLWQQHEFWFFLPAHDKCMEGLTMFGRYMKKIKVGVNQMLQPNRTNACSLLQQISKIHRRRLSHIEILFTGENPYFYSGQEFLDSLAILFSPPAADIEPPLTCLQYVDLSGISVPYDDHVIDILSLNHKHLKSLNIQNKVLVCKVSQSCILRLVQRCTMLTDLRVYHCSMMDDTLKALASEDRTPIEHLSIICRRDEKYGEDLTAEAWKHLVNNVPCLRVTLGFDHTCPFHLIPVIIKPEIPVKTLKLETFAMCFEEINMAARYYKDTLQKLVLQTRNSVDLEQALLNVARECTHLRSLLVYCVVRQEVIDEIFNLLPDMKALGTYILKSVAEPEPWVVGVEEGD